MRLVTYLDFNIHDGSLSWHEDKEDNVAFCILRPFKFLVHFDKEIRTHLADLENSRQALHSGTEEEWEAEWQRNPPPDVDIHPQMMRPQELTLVQLTGLIKELRTLTQFLDQYIAPARTRSPEEPVFFSDLWFTFPAGSLIYLKDRNISQKIWRVIQRTGGRRVENKTKGDGGSGSRAKCTPFVIDCYYLDFDGNRYIPIFHRHYIEPFDGLEPVTSLPVLPLGVAEDEGLIDLDATVERGQTFIECTRPTHRDYTGRNLLQRPDGEDMAWGDGADNASRFSEWIDSEVMVDMDRAMHTFPGWRPSTTELRPFSADDTELQYAMSTHMQRWPREDIDRDNEWDRKSTDRLLSAEADKWQRWSRDHPPTEREDLLLLPSRVFAFVFRTRKWACLQLGKNARGEEMLRRRVPRPEPWNDLELPDGHKNLVQSLIESHIDGNTSKKLQFDLVRAKGKGIIILLHGVPGVGKTSTAECAAEANNRPLLPITCGDLGTSPREVETKLQEAFQLAQIWNCVLLLDEADVFLAQRSEDDIQRNALVSVFLRVLEYYEGILFLTSNRVGVFDEALKSRLHMALYYPPLEWKYTKRIWETHLHKLRNSGLIDLDHRDILDYAEDFFEEQQRSGSTIGPVWNGRQIRNAFQSAVALASFRQQGAAHKILLLRDHFEKVSRVSNQFNNYLWSIKCRTDADKASIAGSRYDYWVKGDVNQRHAGGPHPPQQQRLARHGSIDGGAMTFANYSAAAAAAAGAYAPQPMLTPPAAPPVTAAQQHGGLPPHRPITPVASPPQGHGGFKPPLGLAGQPAHSISQSLDQYRQPQDQQQPYGSHPQDPLRAKLPPGYSLYGHKGTAQGGSAAGTQFASSPFKD
ncbi:hypothetical protein B0I37DRAFT_38322 [Chaetomium sp. MPI-CAGE-AT-0009]|nr:hypothetical protein B0I37DRAFT_38322 [Chaetomium sp. MPI-CAGE-AT-0009]